MEPEFASIKTRVTDLENRPVGGGDAGSGTSSNTIAARNAGIGQTRQLISGVNLLEFSDGLEVYEQYQTNDFAGQPETGLPAPATVIQIKTCNRSLLNEIYAFDILELTQLGYDLDKESLLGVIKTSSRAQVTIDWGYDTAPTVLEFLEPGKWIIRAKHIYWTSDGYNITVTATNQEGLNASEVFYYPGWN